MNNLYLTYNDSGVSTGMIHAGVCVYNADTLALLVNSSAPLDSDGSGNHYVLTTISPSVSGTMLYVAGTSLIGTARLIIPFDPSSNNFGTPWTLPAPENSQSHYYPESLIVAPDGLNLWIVHDHFVSGTGTFRSMVEFAIPTGTGTALAATGRSALGNYNPTSNGNSTVPYAPYIVFRQTAPRHAFSPDKSKLYLIVQGTPSGSTSSTTVRFPACVDVATLSATAYYPVKTLVAEPTGITAGSYVNVQSIDMGGDATTLYCADGESYIHVLDLATDTTIYSVSTPQGLTPTQLPFAVNPLLSRSTMNCITGYENSAQTASFAGSVDLNGSGNATYSSPGTYPGRALFYVGPLVSAPVGGFLCGGSQVVHVKSGVSGVDYYASTPANAQDMCFLIGAASGALYAGMGLHEDAHRRPVAVTAGSAVSYLTSKDGGHSFDGYPVTSSAASNASVWVDPRTNTPRILWDDGAGNIHVAKASKDGEQSDWA